MTPAVSHTNNITTTNKSHNPFFHINSRIIPSWSALNSIAVISSMFSFFLRNTAHLLPHSDGRSYPNRPTTHSNEFAPT